ncbi:MAG TPA: acyl-CoA reductase [Verrucomicrobiae bacterium]|nr:acyl-CoA reductase [Verrucomicrobiae bacterium]
MTLPNYFIADLPPEAEISASMIHDACLTLKRNRERYLAGRSTQSLLERLGEIAGNWLQPDYALRKLALERSPRDTGFSPATLASGLDSFFSKITPENLNALLVQELGHAERLDRFVSTPVEERSGRSALAAGPTLLVHVAAGNLPLPALMSLVLGLIVRSAQFLKCASGASLLPRLFAHSLYEVEPKLAACLEIAEWRGGRAELEQPLFEHADRVTVTGTDETIAEIRRKLPARIRLLDYGQRASFGFITRDLLTSHEAKQLAGKAAGDIAAWNQLGCLSPHLFYIEAGGVVSPEQFAELLAAQMARLEEAEPRGPIPAADAAAIASRRAFYEVRAASSPDTRLWQSDDSTAWTIVYEADPGFQLSCLNRFVYVKPVKDLGEALHAAETVRGKVSTVAIAAPENRAQEIAITLARWGVARLCPIGRMQQPSLLWRHDGRASLGDLVTWIDCER